MHVFVLASLQFSHSISIRSPKLVELQQQHGRVAMLGVVGYLATYAGMRFPGAEDVPAGFAALPAVPGMVWAQFIATVALMEAANSSQQDTDGVKAGWTPDFQGDFRNGKSMYLYAFDDTNRALHACASTHTYLYLSHNILCYLSFQLVGFIDFGWDKQTDEWKKKKRTIELNQGRAAQMGLLGLMVHDQLGNIKTILPLGPQ